MPGVYRSRDILERERKRECEHSLLLPTHELFDWVQLSVSFVVDE